MSNGIKIPFCKPAVDHYEAQYAYDTIKSGWLTTGKMTEQFEKEFADYVGAKHCVLLSSCTSALFLSLQWVKRQEKKYNPFGCFNVLVPALTFAASATEIINAGMRVIFGDVGEDMLLKCKIPIKNNVPINLSAVIPVHLTGKKADTEWGDIPVIEDSAHLIERDQCKDNPNLVCFSFYATKNLIMGEGGAICTNDDEAAAWFRQARHHGISKGGWNRYREGGSWMYDIEFIGWKCNPSDVLASIASANLTMFEENQKERLRCINEYNRLLKYENTGLHLYPILVSDRPKFMDLMKEAGIQCSVHFLPLHQMTAFKEFGVETVEIPEKLENTEFLGDKLVSLPLYPELKNEQIEYICKKIKETNLLLQ